MLQAHKDARRASRMFQDRPWLPQSAIRRAVQFIALSAERNPLLFSLVAVLLLLSLAIVVLRPSYETCDDVLMTMIVAGKGLAPTPDEHLVFTNVLIGKVLKSLYSAYPAFPWYGCYLLLVHYLAQTAMLYGALTIGRRKPAAHNDTLPIGVPSNDVRTRLGLYLIYFCLAELPLLNRFQFTTAAFVASQAGILLMCVAWRRRVLRADSPVLGTLFASVALLLIGGLVRLESLAMAVLVATPMALFFVKDFSLCALRPCGLAAASAAVLVVGGVVYDSRAYETNAAWHGYRSLNQLRGKFHDGSWTFYSPETAPLFARVGWTENDHAMIARWYSDDPDLYSKEKLSSIVAAYPWQASRDYSGLWKHAFRDIARNRYVLAILLVLPFMFLFVHRERTSRLAIVSSLLAAVTLIACVIWFKKVPPQRVFFPLMSFPMAAALMALAWRSESNTEQLDPRCRREAQLALVMVRLAPAAVR